MKVVPVEAAVGMVLGHDLTRILPGEFKGVAFRKGHCIQDEDVPLLKDMGKENIYVVEMQPGCLHENDAALELAAIAGEYALSPSEVKEGKVTLHAHEYGMLHVDVEKLMRLNNLEGIAVSTLHSGVAVKRYTAVASCKIIPLVLHSGVLRQAMAICADGPAVSVLPFLPKRIALIVTGNEVFFGRIQDKFVPVIEQKAQNLRSSLTTVRFAPDDAGTITEHIRELAETHDIVIVSGGMSVDPDDVTPTAIRGSGADIVTYGTPVLPGAMFMMAYLGGKPLCGIPACGMFCKTTILDVLLPRIIAGVPVTKQYITSLGHGGLCTGCDVCRFPLCSFGK